ncbi:MULTISPECIES: LCP family protein [Kocuria]|uniref:LCP family protein n=1 Tax=Kocuria TaxID=57493 RepID=UPI00037E353B|nr:MULTISPECIES: LCP family protein [Kocuria]EYT54226.1 LytR family regulatory protein [Kocuria sp. UCD-OTCP]MCM3485027.1 LCP family protein [Kocuria rosea]TQN35748.1 LytR family transcriptional attenuator [Kocuria rosea]VEI50456.1 Biofilm regulatory protein A precursor [Kocuria rosea]
MNSHTPRAEHDPRPPHDPSAEGSRSRDLPPDAVTAVRGVDDDAASPPRLTDPLRHPQHAGDGTRARRAWTLLLSTLVVPGSAQLVAGRRAVGRAVLKVDVVVWAAAALALLSLVLWRTPLVWFLTNSFTSLLLIAGLVALAVGWALLFFDTLRLIRPGLLVQRTRRAVAAATVALMLVTSGGLAWSAYLLSVTRGAVSDVFGGGLPFRPADGRYNILLMGTDSGEDRSGRRPDSMTVLSVDADSGRTVTVSLPRNLQNAPFPSDSPLADVYPEGFDCGDECILNALYTDVTNNHAELYPDAADPGAEAMKDAASGVLGIEVQAYAIVEMNGFEQLVDALGGITIDVGGRVPIGGGTDLVTGLPNEIFGYIEPGVQRLDGYHALWYARSREGATDYDRQARQRCVQAAMLKQLNPVNVLTRFEDLANSGTQVVETDIPQSQIGSFVDVALKAKEHELVQYAAGPPYYDPSFPTYPDFDLLHEDLDRVLEEATDRGARDAEALPAGTPVGSGIAMAAPLAAAKPLVGTQELTPNGTCSVP